MIYATRERALEVAAMLNERRGYAPSFAAFWIGNGWTVVSTYRDALPSNHTAACAG